MKEKEKPKKIWTNTAIILLTIFILFLMGVSFLSGFILGNRVMAEFIIKGALELAKSVDIQIVANLTINETKLVDYAFEKSGFNQKNKTIVEIQKIPIMDERGTRQNIGKCTPAGLNNTSGIYYCKN